MGVGIRVCNPFGYMMYMMGVSLKPWAKGGPCGVDQLLGTVQFLLTRCSYSIQYIGTGASYHSNKCIDYRKDLAVVSSIFRSNIQILAQ